MIDEIVALDLGITREAAVSGAVVQTEDMTTLTSNAMRSTGKMSPHGGMYRESAGTAVVEFHRRLLTRFGHPNDEARWGLSKYAGCSYGVYEVKNSSWIKGGRRRKSIFVSGDEGRLRASAFSVYFSR